MLQETLKAPPADSRPWAFAPGAFPIAGRRRRAFSQLEAIAVPALLAFAAALAGLLAHDARPADIVTAVILTTVYVGGLELIGRSTWLSPLALGVPVTTALGITLALPVISLLDFWIPGFDVTVAEIGYVAVSTFAVWSIYGKFSSTRLRRPRQRVLVLGRAGGGLRLVEELAIHPDLPFDCVGIVDDDPEGAEPWLGDLSDLKDTVVRERIDIVVFADSSLRDVAMPALLDLGRLDLRVVGLPDFYEHAFGRVPVDQLSETWFMSLMYLYRSRYPLFFKRVVDFALAAPAILLTAPLFPLIALLIVIETRGPVFYRQVRLGEGGELFKILKFRTMVDGAEDPGQALWAEANDNRVTRVGKLLRKTRLDELPQLWNVLRGDMSFVGPRPERPEFLALLEEMVPYWSRRHLVKPGITGWAQVCSGYTSDTSSALEKLSYDLYYIKHRSLILDFVVAAKTATVVLSGSGAR
jgi:exopolysaccharide biosynthesis polyprenyl glycosylphosphotransferase